MSVGVASLLIDGAFVVSDGLSRWHDEDICGFPSRGQRAHTLAPEVCGIAMGCEEVADRLVAELQGYDARGLSLRDFRDVVGGIGEGVFRGWVEERGAAISADDPDVCLALLAGGFLGAPFALCFQWSVDCETGEVVTEDPLLSMEPRSLFVLVVNPVSRLLIQTAVQDASPKAPAWEPGGPVNQHIEHLIEAASVGIEDAAKRDSAIGGLISWGVARHGFHAIARAGVIP